MTRPRSFGMLPPGSFGMLSLGPPRGIAPISAPTRASGVRQPARAAPRRRRLCPRSCSSPAPTPVSARRSSPPPWPPPWPPGVAASPSTSRSRPDSRRAPETSTACAPWPDLRMSTRGSACAIRWHPSPPPSETHVEAIARLAGTHDHTLIEGAGGLLVELDAAGRTLADLAAAVLETAGARGMAGVGGTAGAGGSGRALETAGPAGTLVVCRAALGTLNHTELTIEALTRRRVPVVGLVIGAWPRRPGPIELSNRRHFARHRVPLLGAVPEGAGDLEPGAFRAEASAWFADAVSGALGGATGGALGSTAGRALGGTAGGALGGTAGHALGPTAGPSLHTA